MRTEQPPLEVREKILKKLPPERQAAEARRVAAAALEAKIASLRAEQKDLYAQPPSEQVAQEIAQIDQLLQTVRGELAEVLRKGEPDREALLREIASAEAERGRVAREEGAIIGDADRVAILDQHIIVLKKQLREIDARKN